MQRSQAWGAQELFSAKWYAEGFVCIFGASDLFILSMSSSSVRVLTVIAAGPHAIMKIPVPQHWSRHFRPQKTHFPQIDAFALPKTFRM